MPQITLDAEADQVSAKLTKRALPPTPAFTCWSTCSTLPITAHAGHGFDWLGDEPDLYSDEDLAGHSY